MVSHCSHSLAAGHPQKEEVSSQHFWASQSLHEQQLGMGTPAGKRDLGMEPAASSTFPWPILKLFILRVFLSAINVNYV